jgi:hypothetical protein
MCLKAVEMDGMPPLERQDLRGKKKAAEMWIPAADFVLSKFR